MKVYCLIQEDGHYETDVEVFADKEEAIFTAASRMSRSVPNMTLTEIQEQGLMLNDAHQRLGIVWQFCPFDDGPTFTVAERTLQK